LTALKKDILLETTTDAKGTVVITFVPKIEIERKLLLRNVIRDLLISKNVKGAIVDVNISTGLLTINHAPLEILAEIGILHLHTQNKKRKLMAS
jgi:hypothetical protein